jgi:redox-sensing transcriptional repressor
VRVDLLILCHRLCAQLKREGIETVTSAEIGEHLGVSAAKVRRDLCALGKLGTRGHGYRIGELERLLGDVLGKKRPWRVVLVGAGNLGTALLTHGGFRRRGFRFAAVFDCDPGKVGRKLGGLVVQDVSQVPTVLPALNAEIGVVAVPSTAASETARLLVQNGVWAILNMAPVILSLEGAAVINVDLAVELEKLCYHLTAAKTEKH